MVGFRTSLGDFMISPASLSLRLFLVVALALFAALAFASLRSTSGADPFVVTKTYDTADGTCDTDCSLREPIISANPTLLPPPRQRRHPPARRRLHPDHRR